MTARPSLLCLFPERYRSSAARYCYSTTPGHGVITHYQGDHLLIGALPDGGINQKTCQPYLHICQVLPFEPYCSWLAELTWA